MPSVVSGITVQHRIIQHYLITLGLSPASRHVAWLEAPSEPSLGTRKHFVPDD